MRALDRFVLLSFLGAGCTAASKPATPPAASVDNRRPEASLTTVHLAAEAEARLALETQPIAEHDVRATRTFGAEIVATPGRAITMVAPVAGTVRTPASGALPSPGATVQRGQVVVELVPMAPVDRDLRAQAQRQATSAAARLHALELQADRAERLMTEKAGSARMTEDAVAQRELARAEVDAAAERLRLVTASPLAADVTIALRAPRGGTLRALPVASGQTVAAGAPMFEIVDTSHVWIRVPVFADEVGALSRTAPARVHGLTAAGADVQIAQPIASPPSADPTAATIDLYYELTDPKGGLRTGQRVGVTLALQNERKVAAIPWSAVVYDYEGGAWVYTRVARSTYARRRVAVERVADGLAALTRGPELGVEIVTQGAAELFGVEFGAGH